MKRETRGASWNEVTTTFNPVSDFDMLGPNGRFGALTADDPLLGEVRQVSTDGQQPEHRRSFGLDRAGKNVVGRHINIEEPIIMSKITPHLWFDTQAVEAAEFYSEVFPDSRVTDVTTMHDTPSGDCDTVSFTVWGHEFMAISAGPLFDINPSISFMVNFDPSALPDAEQQLDRVWERLAHGGEVLMALGEYPFSKRYGWVADRYGVTWQLILTNPDGDPRPTIIPSLMFTGDVCGRAAEAGEFYVSVFDDAEVGMIAPYPDGSEPNQPGTTMFSEFRLADGWLTAMDSADDHAFGFNEAVSLMINCSDQAEIDHFWAELSADPEAEQCGWLKDRFGVSWQVNAAELNDMLTTGTQEQVDRVTQAFLPMKKLDLAALRAAYEDVG